MSLITLRGVPMPKKTSPQKLITHPNKGSPKIETERVAGAELKVFDL